MPIGKLTFTVKFPLPSAVVEPTEDAPSKIVIVALAVAVPLTATVVLVVVKPVAGDVIAGAPGATVIETPVLAGLVCPFTVCFAVRVWAPTVSVTFTLKLPLPSAVVEPTWVAPPSKIATVAFAVEVPLTDTEVLVVVPPDAGEVMTGGTGTIVTPAALLGALVTLLTVCFAVRE